MNQENQFQQVMPDGYIHDPSGAIFDPSSGQWFYPEPQPISTGYLAQPGNNIAQQPMEMYAAQVGYVAPPVMAEAKTLKPDEFFQQRELQNQQLPSPPPPSVPAKSDFNFNGPIDLNKGFGTEPNPSMLAAVSKNPHNWDSESFPRRRRKCMYGCIPVNVWHRTFCLLVVGVILATIGILLYLYIPRFPQMKVLSLELAQGSDSFRINMTNNDPNTIQVSLDLVMNVSLVNPNRYALKVENIDLAAFLVANKSMVEALPSPAQLFLIPAPPLVINETNQNRQVGTGQKGDITFIPYRNTSFTMGFSLFYTPDPKIGLWNDPAFAEILQGCGLNGAARPMKVSYKADVTVAILRRLGYTPAFSDEIRVNCPFDNAAITNIVNRLGPNGGSVLASRNNQSSTGNRASTATTNRSAMSRMLANIFA